MTRVGSTLPPQPDPPKLNGPLPAASVRTSPAKSPFMDRAAGLPDAFDIVEKKKAAQHSENQAAALNFLESTIGRKLPDENLHLSLRNGVILCEFINKLRPGSIPVISTRDAPFLQMENINRFLNASKALGLKGHELFQTVDLYEGKDLQQVIITILTIARVVAGTALKTRAPEQANPYRDQVIRTEPTPPPPLPTLDLPPKVPSLPPTPYLHTKSASATQFSTPPVTADEEPDSEANASVPIAPAPKAAKVKKSQSDVAVHSPRRRTDSPSRSRPSTASGSVRSNKGLVEKIVVGNYQLGSGIGKGQFGAVYQALNMDTGQVAAIKRIPLIDQKEKGIQDLMQEVELLKSLSHPNIVKYLGFLLEESFLNIILEFMECGSLQSVMKKYNLLIPEKLAAVYSEDILRGLVYLHGKGVVHCDLKCANILTTKDSNVKLSDFGVSKVLNAVGEDEGGIAGTPYWMAPEIIELKGASTAADIWSLGCTVIEMITGKPPYLDLKNPMTALFRIVEDDSPPLPSDISPELADFFSRCFQRDISKRATAKELLSHEWIVKKYKDAQTAEESLKLLEIGNLVIQESAIPTSAIVPPNPNPVRAESLFARESDTARLPATDSRAEESAPGMGGQTGDHLRAIAHPEGSAAKQQPQRTRRGSAPISPSGNSSDNGTSEDEEDDLAGGASRDVHIRLGSHAEEDEQQPERAAGFAANVTTNRSNDSPQPSGEKDRPALPAVRHVRIDDGAILSTMSTETAIQRSSSGTDLDGRGGGGESEATKYLDPASTEPASTPSASTSAFALPRKKTLSKKKQRPTSSPAPAPNLGSDGGASDAWPTLTTTQQKLAHKIKRKSFSAAGNDKDKDCAIM
ncbi:hypothetical protein HDU87_005079 [Geranomyces variabilis]|uniref:Uncharacterized protein n=1 Tax=Geranomyces variabilis TaxID=109894 RepID=A0AAD5TSQ6_9FUNG|nr:hypothetical protein HDU87_005079 [Geranomyces variabilis]